MGKRIYVGNLPFSSSEDDIRDLFASYGEVAEVDLISDRATGRPRGFGFVEMEAAESAADAINALDGQDFGGRHLKVNEARERRPRGPRRDGPRRDGPRHENRPRPREERFDEA